MSTMEILTLLLLIVEIVNLGNKTKKITAPPAKCDGYFLTFTFEG